MQFGVRFHSGRALACVCAAACSASLHADGPFGGASIGGGGGGGSVPVLGVGTAPPPGPFKDPYELYQRMKADLGLDSGSPAKPTALPTTEELIWRLDALNLEYKGSKDAARKRLIQDSVKQLKLEIETSKHLVSAPDYALRRRVFIADLLDGLVAVIVAKQEVNWNRVFRCGTTTLRSDFLRILKELLPEEVAPLLWQRLEEQVRFCGAQGDLKLNEMAAAKEQARVRISAVRAEQHGELDPDKRKKLAEEEAELVKQIDRVEYEQILMRVAATGRNQEFREVARDLLVDLGAPSARPCAAGLAHTNARVRQEASEVLRRLPPAAVAAELIQVLRKQPSDAVGAWLASATGQRLGADAEAWARWWAASPLNPEAKPEAAAPAPAENPPAPPNPAGPGLAFPPEPAPGKAETVPPSAPESDWIVKVRRELEALRQANERLRAASARKAEVLLLRRALEKQVQEMEAREESAENAGVRREVRRALEESLRKEMEAAEAAGAAQKDLDRLRAALSEDDPRVRVEAAPVYILKNGRTIVAWKVTEEGKLLRIRDFDSKEHLVPKEDVVSVR